MGARPNLKGETYPGNAGSGVSFGPMKQVAQFNFPTEAYPLMARLETAGIPASLRNENVVLVHPFISNAVGGVQVLVPDWALAEAEEIVAAFFKAPPANFPGPDTEFLQDHEAVETWCPNCDAFPVYQKKFTTGKTWLAILVTLITHWGALLFLPKKLTCARCGHHFTR
jgi:hypothetical protein